MNRHIARVGWVAMALLVALVVATTYWQTWARPSLAARQDNEIQRVAEFEIRRGAIVNDPSASSAAEGRAVLARNTPREVGTKTLYFRRYPQGKLVAHVVGYSTVGRARAGLERSLNDVLTGANRSLGSLVGQTLDELGGEPIVGDSVVTTLDLAAQQVALDELGNTCGAVAAFDPRTGRLLVMASSPSYDPNYVESRFDEIARVTADCTPASPLLNRASAGLYPPGSTFKVVTATAALESRKYTPDSTFFDPGYCIAYGKRVNNFDTSRPFGNLTLRTALQHSVNSVFCTIGQKLGAVAVLKTAERFGFYERPPLETPPEERLPSGLYRDGKAWFPSRDADVDAGRMAFGQERLLVTPLQMAMVAGAIGNAGILMKPFVVDRIVSPHNSIVERTEPERLRRAVSPQTAKDVSELMVLAVRAGTGTAAAMPGFRVGGKTGTAETGVPGRNVTWFIAFAGPEGERPHVAIAVVLQNQTSTGGATAAPIARSVMEAILRPPSNP